MGREQSFEIDMEKETTGMSEKVIMKEDLQRGSVWEKEMEGRGGREVQKETEVVEMTERVETHVDGDTLTEVHTMTEVETTYIVDTSDAVTDTPPRSVREGTEEMPVENATATAVTTAPVTTSTAVASPLNLTTEGGQGEMGQSQKRGSKEEKEATWTLFQISKHASDDDLYVAVHGRVYDLSRFWRRHPGGPELIRERAGKDVTMEFEAIHHSRKTVEQLKGYDVGRLR